ncbi:MAG TPA: MFS transporter [Bryobacteraceae bacterium]|nr:MFS transporter [Bryobacteraceae bacterium]
MSQPAAGGRRIVKNLRWWIGGLLFASTVINYIDRQTLSVLAPHLKTEFKWSNQDFALLVIAFRLAYAVGHSAMGRVLDHMGTQRGLLFTVGWYSAAAMLTSLATGIKSFMGFRFLLGLGESANWPGAAKTVAEWFPKHERGWAVALYDSGSAIGGAIAPVLVISIYAYAGSWRPAFIITGLLGLAWLLVWKRVYHPPETHPNISDTERAMIVASKRAEGHAEAGTAPASWRELIWRQDTWGIILGRSLTDPVWFFITDWFAIFLVAKGFKIENTLAGFWIPFLAADLGNFFGGGFSSWLIRRGWDVVKARKFIIVVCGIGMTTLIPAIYATALFPIVGLFAMSTFCYAAWSTMALALPGDIFPSRSVATVSGLSGTGAGLGTILSTFLIGWMADKYSFEPVLITASVIPLAATALVLLLLRRRPVTSIAAGS